MVAPRPGLWETQRSAPRGASPSKILGTLHRYGVPLPPRRMARGAQGNRTHALGPPGVAFDPDQTDEGAGESHSEGKDAPMGGTPSGENQDGPTVV